MDHATMKVRKEVTLSIGDTLLFDPGVGALGGENAAFFEKYAGMKATIREFETSSNIHDLISVMIDDGKEKPKRSADRIFVTFEDGDALHHILSHSLHISHFLLP